MSSHKTPLLSITEFPNELTRDIDLASPLGIVRLLRQSDTQIATGYSTYPALLDEEILQRIESCIDALYNVLCYQGKRRVVISGAGTSGRLATFVCREFNRQLKAYGQEPIFRPLIAGKSLALIVAQEGAEDNPHQAKIELKEALEGAEKGYLFGVTCGFSAPYIAGQLEYCMDTEGMIGVLLGFNPVERARRVEVENWDKTVGDIVDRMIDHPRALFLNPVVGPEPITGSTRMKGGSVTKLLLELVIGFALVRSEMIPQEAFLLPYSESNLRESILAFINEYEQVRVQTYLQSESLGKLVDLGGQTLRNEGHIYYLGQDSSGFIGLVDASECPPTFGADFTDVRGFLEGGWGTLLGPGLDLSDQGPLYRITIEEFTNQILPSAGPSDLVVGLGYGEDEGWLAPYLIRAKNQGVHTAEVLINPIGTTPETLDIQVGIPIPLIGFLKNNRAFGEYATKLAVNALTTGAHILAGKVYENRMIDLRISNNKLYYRTLGIIQKLMGVSESVAKESLVRSIYATDEPTEEQKNAKISTYVEKVTTAKKIVPRALLLSTGKFTVEQATEALKKIPIIRALVEKYTVKESDALD